MRHSRERRKGEEARLTQPPQQTVEQIEAAIAAVAAQRAALGDATTDAALAALAAQRDALLQHESHSPLLKQVSVLFLDVVGSTTLSQHLDPEDINAVMDGALARFDAIVQAHGGRVLQHAGDSVLAVFGAPVAHEDDAVRAVQAGLALLAEGAAAGGRVRAQFGHDGFNVRVGIHSGGVLLGAGVDGEHSIRGMTVNVAARMEQTAPPGGLRISQDCWRQVRGRFDCQAQAPLAIKGRDEPIVTYLVNGPRGPRTQAPERTRGVEGVATPLVGREAEFEALCRAWRESGARLARVTVVGEAGLGKSRLLAEWRTWVDGQARRTRWLVAAASEPTQAQPYALLRALLSDGADIFDSDSAAVARDKWLDHAAPRIGRRDDAAVLGHLLGYDFADHPEVHGLQGEAQALRQRAFFHANQWLHAAASADVPLVAVLDDLHWSDEPTLDFIEHLATAHADAPLLLVALARPSLFERRPGWGTTGAAPEQRLDLAPLDAAHAGTLAGALLSRLADAPASLQALVAGRAEGNPFFMEELVNMLLDQGVLVADGPRWRHVPERLQGLALPTTLVGVLQARLDALPGDEQRTAQLASVVGYRFWDASVTALDEHAGAALAPLVAREVALPEAQSSLKGLAEFRFRHHLLHEVAYGRVLKALKRTWHAQVARWLLRLPGSPPPEQVAEHFERGGEAREAATHWQRAAEAAAERYANAQAVAHAERALGLLGDTPSAAQVALVRLRARVLTNMGRPEALARAIDDMLALATQLDDPALRADGLVLRARQYAEGEDALRALAFADQAVAAAPPGMPHTCAWAHLMRAQCLSLLGRHEQSLNAAEQALTLARAAQDATVEGTILNEMGSTAHERGDLGAAIELFEQALVCHRRAGRRHNEAGTLSNLGYASLTIGAYDEACAQFERAREAFARVGHRANEGITRINLGIAMLHRGAAGDALAQARAALALLDGSGAKAAEGAAWRVIGQALLAQGDPVAAEAALDTSFRLFESLALHHLALEPLGSLVESALARGDPALAVTRAQTILDALAGGATLDGTEEPMRVRLACWRALVAAGDARAPGLLDSTHGALVERAARIADADRRASYLECVPHHREIVAARRRQSPTACS
jgi:class 3 adenylate cyclase/tetratricopeptide (TPR) repeat protein